MFICNEDLVHETVQFRGKRCRKDTNKLFGIHIHITYVSHNSEQQHNVRTKIKQSTNSTYSLSQSY
jgi:hypothetical protein